jgi:FkbM family methyltransferase
MKKILRKIANKFGYDFIKINVHSADKAHKISNVKVGNYNILMPGNNPQISLYKYYPTSNTQLARLTEIILKKYSDATMIDVGANVGDTIAVVKTKIEIPIIAIEGDDASFSFLQKNATQFNDIELIQQFLGEEEKEIQVTIDKKGWNNTIIPSNSGEIKMYIKKLDDVLNDKKYSERNLKLLKIDTEGFDTIILRGSKKIIENHKPIIYIEYNGENMKKIGEDGFTTIMQLKEFGYDSIHIYDCINNLIMVTNLSNESIIKQLHSYTQMNGSMIPYFDLCIFHNSDKDVSSTFEESEKKLSQ